MRLRLLRLLLAGAVAAAATDPAAPPLYASVAKAGFVELQLRGHSQAGLKRRAYVTSIPSSGSLFQLSQPYMSHGRLPAFDESGRITAASTSSPVLVTSTSNKLIFVPEPDAAEPTGEWARFTYKVRATSNGAWSPHGHVVLVPPSKTLVASFFPQGHESWVVRGGSPTADIQHELSRSGTLSNFVHHTDDALDIRAGSTSDSKRWKFCAPIKYLSNFELAYKGELGFTLRSFSGDFSKLNADRDVVTLQCSTCNQNQGMTFVQRDLAWDGKEKAFAIVLSELGGWLKDPKNTNTPWASPSECEMVEMLSSVSELCILGDHTKWYESVGLDNVAIKAGPVGSIPLSCSCANPGTQCA